MAVIKLDERNSVKMHCMQPSQYYLEANKDALAILRVPIGNLSSAVCIIWLHLLGATIPNMDCVE